MVKQVGYSYPIGCPAVFRIQLWETIGLSVDSSGGQYCLTLEFSQ